eukprot:s1076_g3.t1
MAMDRLNRSRRDKLDWAAKLGLGPLAGRGEALPGQGPVPGNAREAQTQRKQAEEMAELRRRIDEKQAEVAASKPPQPEEEVDASGFLNPNALTSALFSLAACRNRGLSHVRDDCCLPVKFQGQGQWEEKGGAQKRPRATDWPEANCGCHLATGRRAATRACGPRARGRKGPRTQETFQATRGARKQSFCKDEKNLKAERRAKQKAATRFQDVEEEYSLDSQGRENRRGRAGRCDEEIRRAESGSSWDSGPGVSEDSEEERRYRSRSGAGGRLSEDPYGRGRGDRSRSYDRYYDDDDDSSEIRRRKRQKEKRSGEKSGRKRRRWINAGQVDAHQTKRVSLVISKSVQMGAPKGHDAGIDGVQRKYADCPDQTGVNCLACRAATLAPQKLLTEAEAIALLQGGNKRRR